MLGLKLNHVSKRGHRGEQSEQYALTHTLWQPTFGCIAIFKKYCCFTKKWAYYNKFDSMKCFGVYHWYAKIPQSRCMEYGLKDVAFYIKKNVALWPGHHFFFIYFIYFLFPIYSYRVKHSLAVLPCCPVYTHDFNTHKIHEIHKIHFQR